MILKAYFNPETSHVFLVSEEPITKGGQVVINQCWDIDGETELREKLLPIDDEHILTRNGEIVTINDYMQSKYGCATRE